MFFNIKWLILISQEWVFEFLKPLFSYICTCRVIKIGAETTPNSVITQEEEKVWEKIRFMLTISFLLLFITVSAFTICTYSWSITFIIIKSKTRTLKTLENIILKKVELRKRELGLRTDKDWERKKDGKRSYLEEKRE